MEQKRLVVDLPPKLKKAFDIICAAQGKSKSSVIKRFIEKYVVRYGK